VSKTNLIARCGLGPALLATLVGLLAPAAADAARRQPSGRPDREMYFSAKAAQQRLERPSRRGANRSEWEKVAQAYRALVARYPQSPYCDDALLRTGDIYRDMGERFRSERYLREAVRSYNALVSQYPSSSLGEQALYSAFEIERGRHGNGSPDFTDAARRYIENFPRGPHAPAVRASLHTRMRASAPPTLPDPPPPGLARVLDLRAWSSDATTRVAIFLEKRVKFQQGRIENPDRLYIDLLGTRLHPNLASRSFPVGDGLLQQVRIAQYNPEVVRIVLDFKDAAAETVFCLDNPVRLIVDMRAPGRSGHTAGGDANASPLRLIASATATPTPSEPSASRAPSPAPTAARAAEVPAEADSAASEAASERRKSSHPDRRAASPALPSEAPPSPTPAPARSDDEARPEASEAAGPQPNRSGSYSIARQFGLGARRIVIDPGHGGHDPGTIGRNGLQEKDLVLDVALRLERLIRERLHLDVVMTRRTDVFIPLEERTAIANAKEADLFLSIHVNSSRASRASGVETYYLSFAMDEHAEEVAARENAISPATLKDLSGLVRAIMQNSKIEESRDFATNVQTAMVSRLRPANDALEDRGVRRAPFYVLLGANMPSVLAEIAFVSHRTEERLLRSAGYRDAIADGLLQGIRHYLDDLGGGRAQALAADGYRELPSQRTSRR
jgi:N-acetylmuramoyl-L-alanine amidase